MYKQSYASRIQNHTNPAARLLLEIMERKQSNLAVSVDVTKAQDFLAIIDAVGPYVCMIKTHVDVIEDFEPSLVRTLQALSAKYDFCIFEDRKFADIGNTVALQYASGVYKIAEWSHLTNAHPVPGPSVVTGLKSVGLQRGRGLLLLAEMSTAGALTTGSYTEDAVRMARANRDFVVGFIAQRRMESVGASKTDDTTGEDFLILTPGVGLDVKGDSMGQQYRTPREVVVGAGCDVIIVGRGVYGTDYSLTAKIAEQARRYQEEGWKAYLERLTA